MKANLNRTHGAGVPSFRVGTILAAPVGGYVRVQVGGEVELGILRGYTPEVGDSALVVMQGATGYVVGALGDAPPGPSGDDVSEIYLEQPAHGSAVFLPNFVGTSRGGVFRDTRDLYQGDGSDLGLNYGVAYYGSQANGYGGGVTPTGLGVTVERLPAGPPEAVAPTFWLVPDAAFNPVFAATESFTGPLLSVGVVTTVELPPEWADALVAGTANGVGIYTATETPYVRLAGDRMELRMDWRM